MVAHRSTKGASKARRDHINHEIRNMRALLPISQDDQERLSYLHSMAAICAYIRKSVLFQGLPAGEPSPCAPPYEAFLGALHGFLLVATAQGKLVYVSENVAHFVGLSMVDVLQGDTIYELVERSEVDVVRFNLDVDNNLPAERSFVCCMQTSKAFKLQHGGCCSMLVRGRFQLFPRPSTVGPHTSATGPLFVALCTPTVNRLTGDDAGLGLSFCSQHRMDMSFAQLSDSVVHILGHTAEELVGRSWYTLLHHEDLFTGAASHTRLVQADDGFQVEVVLRFQRSDLSWTWIYIRANKDSEQRSIICTNYIISEAEANFLQEKISNDAFTKSLVPNYSNFTQQAPQSLSAGAKSSQKQGSSTGRSVGARSESEQDIYWVSCTSTQGDASPVPMGDGSDALFIPPYSPSSSASSCSPLQREELGRDPLMDVHECTDQLPSSPEASPSYHPHSEAPLTCHQSPADSFQTSPEETFDHTDFAWFSSSSSSSSSSSMCDFQASAQLVPDCFPASEMCDGLVDCASLHPDDFGLLEEPPGGAVAQPHMELPFHLAPPSPEANIYSERERVEISILAQQISSLVSSFDVHRSLNLVLQNAERQWHFGSTVPADLASPHEDWTVDSLLKELHDVPRKELDSVPADMNPFGLQLGLQNFGLHQLRGYTETSLQQDGFAEENLF